MTIPILPPISTNQNRASQIRYHRNDHQLESLDPILNLFGTPEQNTNQECLKPLKPSKAHIIPPNHTQITTPTLRQNLRISTLLTLLNTSTTDPHSLLSLILASDTPGNLHLTTLSMENTYSEKTNEDSVAFEAHTAQQMQAQFERGFGEVMRLLDQARNAEPQISSVEEKERKGLKNTKGTNIGIVTKDGMGFEIVGIEGILGGIKPVLAGRKPLRVIAAELQRRIELLKSNQTEWDAFKAKIVEYKKIDEASSPMIDKIDILKQNKEVLMKMRPEIRTRLQVEM
ncbi:hypothetical protein HK096_001006, partial [Nowakowskiella sp. JEL0078]